MKSVTTTGSTALDLSASPLPAATGAASEDPSTRDPHRRRSSPSCSSSCFLGWAAVARLDAAAIAPGRLVVSGQRQTVQHREGGVVSQILVKEGAKVAARPGPHAARRRRRPGAGTRADRRRPSPCSPSAPGCGPSRPGRSSFAPPAEFAELAPEDRAAAADALRLQQTQLRTRAAVLSAQRGVLGQRTAQAGSQGSGSASQVAGDQRADPADRRGTGRPAPGRRARLRVAKPAARAGARQGRPARASAGNIRPTSPRSSGQAGETRLQVLEAQSNYLERVATELRDVEASLGDVLPKLSAARDQLARIEIRAPATGTVVGLTVFTPGGVIAPGQKLLDIVPDRAPLTIEARCLQRRWRRCPRRPAGVRALRHAARADACRRSRARCRAFPPTPSPTSGPARLITPPKSPCP